MVGQFIAIANVWHIRHIMNTKNGSAQQPKMMCYTDPNNTAEMNPGAYEGQAIPVCYKSPTTLLMWSRTIQLLSLIENK